MITLSPEDFRKLSTICQQEILALLTGGEVDVQPRDDEMSLPFESGDRFIGLDEHLVFQGSEMDHEWTSVAQTPGLPETGTKTVIDISPEQARELIANVSEKSQEALRLFASGQPVLLEVLIGPSAPYRDLNDLKRSLVGAVNRRLRTVTENRSAVLFSSDRDKTRIRVTPLSAAALRQALNVQEPLPNIEYFDQHGHAIAASSELAVEFQNIVQEAWVELSLRPYEGRAGLTMAQIFGYLLGHGFKLATGKPVAEEEGNHSLRYEFKSIEIDAESLLRQMDLSGNIRFGGLEHAMQLRGLLRHSSLESVYGLVVPT